MKLQFVILIRDLATSRIESPPTRQDVKNLWHFFCLSEVCSICPRRSGHPGPPPIPYSDGRSHIMQNQKWYSSRHLFNMLCTFQFNMLPRTDARCRQFITLASSFDGLKSGSGSIPPIVIGHLNVSSCQQSGIEKRKTLWS